jgi:hypothetical protein
MSYIVCSNTTDDNERRLGISSPASFMNNFRSPLEIEPNSEVAVESIKINRRDEFDIVADDEFFVYFGEELSSSVKSGLVPTNGVKIDVPVGTYSRKTFANVLQTAINIAPLNPAIYGKAGVEINQDGDLEFDGFKFTFNGRISSNASDISSTMTSNQVVDGNPLTIQYSAIQSGSGLDDRAFTYDPISSSLNCCNTRPGTDYSGNYFRSDSCARFQTPPLANTSGVFSVSIDSASMNSWLIGLSRPTTAYYNNAYPAYLSRTENGQKNDAELRASSFCDYWVEWSSASNTGGIDKLKVKHWGKNNTREWTQKEIEYWKVPASNFNGSGQINASQIKDKSLKHLIWILDGNQLKLYISQTPDYQVGKSFFLVDSALGGIGNDAIYNYPPMGNAEEWLSPVISMTNSAQNMVITTLEVFNDFVSSFPTTRSQALLPSLFPRNNELVSGTDWWSRAETSSLGRNEIRFNELRPATLWYGNTDAPADGAYRYKNLNASGLIDYSIVIIPNKERVDPNISVYDQELYVIPDDLNQANMGRALGFSTFTQIKQSVYGLPLTGAWKSMSINSINAGEFAVTSCFVRVNDLTFRSYNGAKNSRSQILYHIPRFTNDGRTYGELFFNAPEKTYLKLHNTEKIMINQLSIDIVNRNEVVVSDLTGGTIVALHIRKSK